MITAQAVRTSEPPRLPTELLGSVPRDVRLTSGGFAVAMTAIALAIAALVSAIVMSVAYARSESERQLRQRESSTAEAEVVRIAVTRGEEERRTVTYRYEVDGRGYTGSARLRRSDRRDLKNGDPIQIRYLASRPQTNWLTGYEPGRFPLWTIPLVAVSLLLPAVFVARSCAAAMDPAVGRTGDTGARHRDEEGPPRQAHRVSRELRIPDAQRREADRAM